MRVRSGHEPVHRVEIGLRSHAAAVRGEPRERRRLLLARTHHPPTRAAAVVAAALTTVGAHGATAGA